MKALQSLDFPDKINELKQIEGIILCKKLDNLINDRLK